MTRHKTDTCVILRIFMSHRSSTDLFVQLPPVSAYNGPNYAAQNNAPNGIAGLLDKGRPTFGVDLAEQMARDNVEVPPIVAKCCEAIEKHGIRLQGIYRVSGMSSKVANLKQRLDKGEV